MLKEPLLHFVLLGALLFAADAFLRERTVEAGGGDIVVSGGRIESLAALFAKTWQRPPTSSYGTVSKNPTSTGFSTSLISRIRSPLIRFA